MLNETDLKIERMQLLKAIGEAISAFSKRTGIEDVYVGATCTSCATMTSDGKMHDGLNVSFTCDVYGDEEEDGCE